MDSYPSGNGRDSTGSGLGFGHPTGGHLARKPSLERKLSRIVAAMESQAPFRCTFATP
jgi:hypothetical protein